MMQALTNTEHNRLLHARRLESIGGALASIIDQGSNNPTVAFGRWLETRRKQLRLSQAKTADLLGVSLPTYRKTEDGTRNITLVETLRIIRELGVA